MKYKITLNDRVYEVEVERGVAEVVKEYDYVAPAPWARLWLPLPPRLLPPRLRPLPPPWLPPPGKR